MNEQTIVIVCAEMFSLLLCFEKTLRIIVKCMLVSLC